MKKLHSLVFYALMTPAITFGSSALLAEKHNSDERDLGEQSMGHDADPDTQSSEQDKDVTKSKYNKNGQTEQTEQKKGDPCDSEQTE
ncbi:MAG: hypothetical protein ABR522_08645 [Marinobacter sp.]